MRLRQRFLGKSLGLVMFLVFLLAIILGLALGDTSVFSPKDTVAVESPEAEQEVGKDRDTPRADWLTH